MPVGEPVGVTALIDGMSQFRSDADEFNNKIGAMGSAVQSGAGLMSSLGDVAKGALSYAVGTLAVEAFNSLRDSVSGFFEDALGAEQQQAQLAIQVRNTNQSLAEQAVQYAATAGQTVTSTALSTDALAKLNDQYTHAKAKLDDMEAAMVKNKHPTETQTLALQDMRAKVAALSDEIANGSKVITNNVEALNKIPPAAGFTVEGLNKLAVQYRDLVGGSDEAVIAIEQVGLQAGSVSADQMPSFIQTVADLGTVMGSTSAAALLLARANEDPVAAMTKANRAGILFDATLKEQIKTLVKHNQTGEATKLVLDRIAQATAGAAAANANTLAGRIEILKNHFADMGKGILEQVLPTIEKLFDQYITPNIPKIEAFADAIGNQLKSAVDFLASSFDAFPGDIIGAIGDMLYKIAGSTGIDAFNQLGDAIVSLPGLFAQVQAAITPLVNFIIAQMPAVQTALSQAWTWVLAHQDEIKGAFIAIGVALAAAGIAAAIAGVVGAIAALATGIGPVIAIVAVLGAAWAGNWGDIQGKTAAVWAWLQPILASLWDWLQTNLPIALQTLSDFWTNTLLPAINQVWAWMTGTLFPDLNNLWVWLGTTLTAALQTLSDFWTGTLQPALTAVWAWMNDPLFPFLSSLANLLGVLIVAAIQGWIDIWNDHLSPAITTFYNFLNDHVFPLISTIGGYLTATLGPAFTTVGDAVNSLVSGAMAGLKGILDYINTAISNATGAINALIALINSIPGVPSVGGAPGSSSTNSPSTVSGPDVSSGALGNSSTSSSSSVSYNYAPTYGQGPVSPVTDFAIMRALAT